MRVHPSTSFRSRIGLKPPPAPKQCGKGHAIYFMGLPQLSLVMTRARTTPLYFFKSVHSMRTPFASACNAIAARRCASNDSATRNLPTERSEGRGRRTPTEVNPWARLTLPRPLQHHLQRSAASSYSVQPKGFFSSRRRSPSVPALYDRIAQGFGTGPEIFHHPESIFGKNVSCDAIHVKH